MTCLRLESTFACALNRTTFSILIQKCMISLPMFRAVFRCAASKSCSRLITRDSKSRLDLATAYTALRASLARNLRSRTKSPESHFISSSR